MPSSIAKLILSLAFVASSAIATRAQDAVTFRYQFEPGEKLTYDISTTVKQTQNVNGQAVKSDFAISERTEREVTQVSGAGDAVLKCQIQKLTASIQIGPQAKYQYDSSKPDNEASSHLGAAATPLYNVLSKASVRLTVSPKGEIQAVEGLQEALADVLKSNQLTQQLVGGATTNEGAKASYAEHFLQFPERALAPGDTWEMPLQLPIPQVGKVSGTTTCRYEGTEEVGGRTLHRITSRSDITVDVDINRDGVTATGKIEMTNSSGTNLFDLKTGRLINRESQTTTSGDLIVVAGGQKLPIRQTQTQTHKIRLVETPSPASR